MPGIYLHIPFCKQACSYCDFYFMTNQQYIPDFVDAIIKETEQSKPEDYLRNIETIYFGGGTPSLLSPAQIMMILDAISSNFDTSSVREITFEMNPDDVTPGYINTLKDLGITRLSMGVQSFQPQLLDFMHRAHNREEALRSLEVLSASGMDWNTDLIYGNPGQTSADLEKDINEMLSFNPPHISAYSLTIEPKTRLGKMHENGKLQPVDDDIVAEHMALIVNKLADQNIQRYEISNYAIPGREALHNSNYWEHIPYLGFGPSAHSFLWAPGDPVAKRQANWRNLKRWIAGPPVDPDTKEILTLDELAEERIMLGLRTRKGISLENIYARYDYRFSDHQKKYIDHLVHNGYAEYDNDRLRLSSEGFAICDEIAVQVISKVDG